MGKGMNMQDKEFDDLFRSKFEDFEVQPSAEVWQNIDAELSGKKKKSIFSMLSIAASVLIALTAGVLFIPKQGTVKPNKEDTSAVVKAIPSTIKPESSAKLVNSSEKHLVKQTTKANQAKIRTVTAGQQEQLKPSERKGTKPEDQPLVASTGRPMQNESIKQEPIELTEAISVAVKKTEDNSAISLPVQPALASSQPAKTKPTTKKHGIRNFGDIVNLVVAKVDKRKDKLIQFSDTDDDESVISAVHLGALKIKKDN